MKYYRNYQSGMGKTETAEVKKTGSILLLNDVTGLPETVPTYSVIEDGQETVSGLSFGTASFNAQCVTGVLK